MNIILVRHGRAKRRERNSEDSKRPLTKTGKDQIHNVIHSIKNLIPDTEIAIWSSPVLRASETAQIISNLLKVKEIEYLEFLAGAPHSVFLENLKNIDQSKTLIIVGHEPYLSEWSFILCGTKLQFKKGTAGVFHTNDVSEFKGKLKLLVHANQCTAKTGYNKNYDLVLLKYIDEARALQHTYLSTPNDVECIHHIRVKIRQLRCTLSFMKPLLKNKDYLILQKKLKDIALRFSYTRELDVINKEWDSIKKENQGALNAVLKSERKKENLNVFNYISDGNMNIELLEISNLIEAINTDEFHMSAFADKRLKSWYKKADKLCRSIDFDNIKAIHNLRVHIKKLRYLKDSLKITCKKYEGWNLEEMQESLGIICDAFQNISLLQSFNDKHGSAELSYETGILIEYENLMRRKSIKYFKSL